MGLENWLEVGKKEMRERDILQAKAELTEAEAMKVLLSNNTIAATIEIAGMEMGVCDNSWLVAVVDKQIAEINKFINEEENLWE